MRIIVDIDNTLWDFATPLWKKIEHFGVPRPSEWHWDFWKEYFSIEQFLDYIDEVHEEQDANTLPFPEAAEFLSGLKKSGCHITESLATGAPPAGMSLKSGLRCMTLPVMISMSALIRQYYSITIR